MQLEFFLEIRRPGECPTAAPKPVPGTQVDKEEAGNSTEVGQDWLRHCPPARDHAEVQKFAKNK